jgi:hypothetical protein
MIEKWALLKERGWYQWYNDGYWCHEQFAAPGVDPTTRGLSTNEAYSFETDHESKEKTLKGMALYFGALNALSNLGFRKNHH